MPGAETVKLQVELVEKNAEARLKELDKLAKEMGNRKITLNFDESSLARWKAATDGMTSAQLSAYAKMVTAAESANAKIIAAGQKSTQVEMQQNAKLVTERQKSFDKKIELYEKEDTKRRQIAARTTQEEIKAQGKISVATMKGAKGIRQQTQAQKELNTEAEKTDGIFSSLTSRFTAANLISSAVTRGITLLRTALRQAVDEMKEMDKELTTIKMVTGASDADISKLRDDAFRGASANGRSVTDYLTASERFARAGYRENIADLTQLSLTTQNVGGVTEEVASKFILAADAAWKLGGNTEALTAILDGMASVSDQNATDIGKLAEGMTVAGSAFANAGETAQTYTALMGTVTAATQRSGSEVARGLQTILFRTRQVKGELDDGELISAEDISNAAKALDSVGISVLNDANELKSFSEIMGELNEKWDKLNTKQKAYLQNALAGNRRGNILFALMDNYDVYMKQLEEYETASGAAAEKNKVYTDSWEAATNNLNTAWTENISLLTSAGGALHNLVTETEKVVKGLNQIRRFEKANRESFSTAEKQGWLTPEDIMMYEEFGIISEQTQKKVNQYNKSSATREWEARRKAEKAQQDLVMNTEDSTDALDEETKAVTALAEAFENAQKSIKNASEAMKTDKDSSVKSAADVYKTMQEAAEKGYYGSNAYKEGAKLFFGTSDKSAVSEVAQEALDAYFEAISEGDYSNAAASLWGSFADESGDIVDKTTGEVIASMHDAGDSYEWAFNKGNKSISEFLASMESATGIGADFWASMIQSLGMYSDEMDNWIQKKEETSKEPVETEVKAKTDDAIMTVKEYEDVLNSVPTEITTTFNVVTKGSLPMLPGEMKTRESGGNAGTPFSQGGWNYKLQAGGKRDNYSGIALVNDEFPADGSKPELIISKSQGRAYIANGGKPALVNLRSDDIVLTAKETQSTLGIPGFPVGKNIKESFDKNEVLPLTVKTPKDPNAGKKPDGGGGSESSADASASWDQLKKLIDYMIDQEKDVLDDKLAILDDQLKELEAARKSQNRMDELAQKLVAVDEAQLDLQKAQSERTVRYYNESTHQWEWMADQGTLAKAEEAYATALKNLNDFLVDLDFEKQKEAIQAQKDALQEAFDAYKEGWDLIVESIEAPTGDLVELFADLKANGTDAMKAQSKNIETLLGALADGFFTGIEDTTLASQTGIADTLNTINTLSQNSFAIAQKAIENIRSRADTLSISASETAKTTLLSISTDANGALTGMSKDANSAISGVANNANSELTGMSKNAQGSVLNFSAISSQTLESILGKAQGTLNTMASDSASSVGSLASNVGTTAENALSGAAGATQQIANGANDFLKSATDSASDVSKNAIESISKVADKANSFLDSVKNVNKQQTEEKKAEAAKVKSGSGSKSGTKDKKETKPKKEKEPVLKTTTGNSIIKKAATGLVEAATKQDLAKKAITNTVANMVKKVTSTVNNNGGNTYVNGLKIGEDQMKQPLSNVLNTLKLHTNITK